MSIRLKVERCSVISLDDETITLGSDPSCTVPIPASDGLASKHAVIRKIAGRWIVEVRGGEKLRVGNDDHTRMHWLNPGDVIRLTDDCATITFEPSESEPKATRDEPAAAGPNVRSIPTATSKPTPREPEMPRSSKTKSVVVSSFEAAEQQGEIKSLPPVPKPTNPAKPFRPSRPTPKPDAEFAEAPASAPVLKRMNVSSWSENSQFASTVAAQHRARRRFWIQTGGVGLLVAVVLGIWIAAGSRPSIPSQTDVVPTRDPDIDTPARPEAPTVASNRDTASTSEEKVSSTSPRNNDDSQVANTPRSVRQPSSTPVGSGSKPGVDADTAVSVAPAGSKGSQSVAMQATRDGVFAVLLQHSDGEQCFRIGTAWVASRRSLVTSGAVAMAVEELQRDGLKIVVSQPGLERPVVVEKVRVNPAYRSAAEKAAIARQQIADADSTRSKPGRNTGASAATPESELARANVDQARFDLGVLDVAAGERLKHPLNLDTSDLPDVVTTEFVLIGFPFGSDGHRTKSLAIDDEPGERTSLPKSAAKSESSLALSMEFPNDVAEDNWSGSPVLNRARRVIGVYSRVAAPTKGDSTPRRHSIIWLGRLVEFAPELE